MQDIPRNELLDKLAAGWKVRRKSWALRRFMSQGDGNISVISWQEMIENDWEGEPPGPALMYKNCAITFAFEKLRNGAASIRRTAWTKASICKNTVSLTCYIEDILATDWEVWK